MIYFALSFKMGRILNLTEGSITGRLLRYTVPMMAGSLMQQCYNIADTLIVGRFVGAGALAAVGSSYTLMVFLVSVLLGLSMGSGTVMSMKFGAGDGSGLRRSLYAAFVLTAGVSVLLNAAAFIFMERIMYLLQVPDDVFGLMEDYLEIIFCGIFLTFIYNFFASVLRAVGDSLTPLWFLGGSVVLNIALDLVFILLFGMGVKGAAWATVISQGVSAAGVLVYVLVKCPELRPRREDMRMDMAALKEIASFSSLTCIQQSVMNLGILAVQGIVNGFGTAVMAAFAAAVKIDSFAYMPVQEFGNAFSTFVAQNFGAGKKDRIRRGLVNAFAVSVLFSSVISVSVFLLARPLMLVFVQPDQTEIIRTGIQYLRIEGAFYPGIAVLFLFYGYFRAIRMPSVSVLLTVLSLGTRVALSYWLSAVPAIGAVGIWWSIPIGWAIADAAGFIAMRVCRGRMAAER